MIQHLQNGFEAFCGSVFWNKTLTWNTVLQGDGSVPDFTSCFQQTVASWLPCGFFWLTLPFYVYYLSTVNNKYNQGLTAFSATKTGLCLLLAVVSLYKLSLAVEESTHTDVTNGYLPPVVIHSSALNVITMVAAGVLVQYYRLRGCYTSGVLWFYWSLWCIGSAIPFYSQIVHLVQDGRVAQISDFIISSTYFSLVLVQFILSCISDANADTRGKFDRICPEFLSSFTSYLTYNWLTPIVALGYRKNLDLSDLWSLGPNDVSKDHVPAFEADWEKAVNEWRKRKKMADRCSTRETECARQMQQGGEASPLIAAAPQKEPSLSLARVLARHYGSTVLVAFACKFAFDWLQFIDPQIQNLLISFVSARNDPAPGQARVPLWHGCILSLGLLSSQLVQTSLFQQLWYLSMVAGFRVRAALISIIYKKALKMSSEARKGSTVGEIVNLMAVDAQRVQDAFSYFWILWSAPLQIGIALWQLYLTVGPSLFMGLGVMLVAAPLNGYVAVKQRMLQMEQMKVKDERIKVMNEVLGGIKVIKLYAWEPTFEDKVCVLRRREMETISKAWYYRVVQFFTFASLPVVVTVATYALYVYVESNHILSPNVAFVTLSLFNIVRTPLYQFPLTISYSVMSNVSLERISNFFAAPDLAADNVERDDKCDVSLRIKDGTFSWLPADRKVLRGINMQVATGSLTAVVGHVGSGKSSLLAACVGDLYKHSGHVTSKGTVAFVGQQAWIQNATVRENILFGLDYDEEWYNMVVEAVALEPDFNLLENGDQTVIGEKGVNLSGGQKQRVSLARACYSKADLYLLDDPLSAVDVQVGKHIFNNAIGPNGLLKDKTRLLVTHGVHWLLQTDSIIVLNSGHVSERATYDTLLSRNGPFAEFLKTFILSESGILNQDAEDEHETSRHQKSTRIRSCQSISVTSINMSGGHEDLNSTWNTSVNTDQVSDTQEFVHTGKVRWSVYRLYAKAMGFTFVALTFICLLVNAALQVAASIWLSCWTNDVRFVRASSANFTDGQRFDAVKVYLGVYGGIGVVQALLNLIFCYSFARCSIGASRFLHEMLLCNIIKAKMSFFNTKPLGQILNRFSKDIDVIDNVLGFTVLSLCLNISVVIGTVIIISYSTPPFMLVVLPIAVVYYFIQGFFIPTTRQLKRLESVTRSPIYTHFSETIIGAQTIRGYRSQERFIQQSRMLVEQNIVCFFAGWTANRWLAIRLEAMAAVIVCLTAAFCVLSTEISYLKSHITNSLAGLAISYALSSTHSLNVMIRNFSDLESNIVSVERVKEYSEVPTEADWNNHDNAPPRCWPTEGAIQFKRYSARYRPDLDMALKDVDIVIKPREKVGIVGRTGAGKSSMTLALFRLMEATKGVIYIDKIDIGTIGLHQLRTVITVLPQDPVLFSGTLRQNLDPDLCYSDSRIWEVLEQSHLKDYVERQTEKLNFECGEGGHNLSVGQRQLMCLARALLRKTKILVLDEATAAVDIQTDNLIQETIRSAFANCTVLTVAHRLNTIIDSDRILVLDQGQVAEFDTARNLLANKDGLFYEMAKDAGYIS